MALQCTATVWPWAHRNWQREIEGQCIFIVYSRRKWSMYCLHCQGLRKQCHTMVVAVWWKVLVLPELAWKRTGSRSMLFYPFTWICWHGCLGHCSLTDVWQEDLGSAKPLQLWVEAVPRQSERMRWGKPHRCSQGRGSGELAQRLLCNPVLLQVGGGSCWLERAS